MTNLLKKSLATVITGALFLNIASAPAYANVLAAASAAKVRVVVPGSVAGVTVPVTRLNTPLLDTTLLNGGIVNVTLPAVKTLSVLPSALVSHAAIVPAAVGVPAARQGSKKRLSSKAGLTKIASDITESKKTRGGAVGVITARLRDFWSGRVAAKDSVLADVDFTPEAADSPERGLRDAKLYEKERRRLRRRAKDGELTSMAPITDAHKGYLKTVLSARPWRVVFMDYDDTLEGYKVKATADTARHLAAVRDAGIQPVILTARPLRGKWADLSLLDSISRLTRKQRAGLIVASQKKGEVAQFDAKGKLGPVVRDPGFSRKERWGLRRALLETSSEIGVPEEEVKRGFRNEKERHNPGKFQEEDVDLWFLGVRNRSVSLIWPTRVARRKSERRQKKIIRSAAKLIRTALKAKGLHFTVSVRLSQDPKNRPPYITIRKNKITKGAGVKRILADLGIEDTSEVISIGDAQFPPKDVDVSMARALPKGLSFAVGKKATPGAKNLFFWGSEGHRSTMEILDAVMGKAKTPR